MVADTTQTPGAKKRRSPTVMDIGTKVRIRNLYLVQCLPYAEIARRVDCPLSTVTRFIERQKLPAIRKENEAKAAARHDAQVRESVDEISEAIASQSEEIALSGLERAREATEDRGEFAAKDFQSWSGGVSNLVKTARAIRGMDRPGATESINVSLYLCRGETLEAPMKCADVIPVETKQIA